MVSKKSSQMGRVPLVTQNQNLLTLGDNGLHNVKKLGLEFGPQQYYLSKKVCRMEFKTQLCEFRNPTMQIE